MVYFGVQVSLHGVRLTLVVASKTVMLNFLELDKVTSLLISQCLSLSAHYFTYKDTYGVEINFKTFNDESLTTEASND